MVFRSHSRAAGGIHTDSVFRKEALEQKGIGYHTDIRTEAYQFDFQLFLFVFPVKQFR